MTLSLNERKYKVCWPVQTLLLFNTLLTLVLEKHFSIFPLQIFKKILRPTKCFTKIYNTRDLRILTIFDILYAIMFCQGPVCYPGTVVTGWGTERNNNFIFHSGHTTPSSLWDLNILNTNKLVNILMCFLTISSSQLLLQCWSIKLMVATNCNNGFGKSYNNSSFSNKRMHPCSLVKHNADQWSFLILQLVLQ